MHCSLNLYFTKEKKITDYELVKKWPNNKCSVAIPVLAVLWGPEIRLSKSLEHP